MSDLISRSKAVQRLIQETVDSKNNLIHINTVKRLLQDVDTSYDIDKVIEQLEEKIVITWKHDYDGGRKDAFNEAIEIVKHGGMDYDVCKWAQSGDMAISPHTFSKYRIKQCDGLYALNICPHCRKKIKVVE